MQTSGKASEAKKIINVCQQHKKETMSRISFWDSTFGFFMIRKSDAFLSDYQLDLNSQPLDHQSNVLLTVLERNLLKISEVSFLLLHAPLHMLGLCLFLESIEHNFIKALMIHTHNQIVT